MDLIVGATGRLGRLVTRKLLDKGHAVRAMTRTPSKAEDLKQWGAEIVQGDLRDPASLARACQGVDKLLAASVAFIDEGDNNPKNVDLIGNRNLIAAAKAAGVDHFVFTSILGATATSPLDVFRYKHAIENDLRASGLSYTILQAGAFMEFWTMLIGEPIIKTGKTTIFGRGNNLINFVSAADVAEYAVFAMENPAARNCTIEVAGPENLSLNQVAGIFEKVTGRTAKKSHVPLPVMRVMSVLMRPLNPGLARQITAGVLMDTTDQTFQPGGDLKRSVCEPTRMEDYVRRVYA